VESLTVSVKKPRKDVDNLVHSIGKNIKKEILYRTEKCDLYSPS